MNKLLDFLKKNYLFSIIGAAVLLIIIIALIVFAKRGTFGLDNENNYLTLECSNLVDAIEGVENTDNMRQCLVRLHYDDSIYTGDKKILSVNANFSFSSGVSYVDYLAKCPVTDKTECDVAEDTENGFAIGDLNGLDNDSLIGTLYVRVDESLTDATLTVGLTNIELSDSDYEMVELNDASGTIVIGNGGNVNPPEPSTNSITFAGDLSVDEDNKIVYNIPLETTYASLLSNITTNGTVTLKDKNGEAVNGDNLSDTLVGTNYSILVTFDNAETLEYKMAVSDDFNGDGKLMNGDFRVFLRLFKADDKELIYRYVGGFNTDVENTSLTNGNLRKFIKRFKEYDNAQGNGE